MHPREFVGGLLAGALQQATRLRPDQRRRLVEQLAHIPALTDGPVFSVLMPVYEPPREWLAAAIDSVRAQVYPRWQLCIADDASPSPWVREFLTAQAAGDHRISIIFRDSNGHISAATNSALELADGDYVTLMDNDDALSSLALLHGALHVIRNPSVKVFYTDEDKVDVRGRRFGPYRKPDYNRDLFYSHNLLSHLTFFESGLLRSLGGFRSEYDGSQDYDLALRAAAAVDHLVGHIPHVAYHWRTLPTSTSRGMSAKGYAADAGSRAVAAQLGAGHTVVRRDGPWDFNGYRVEPPESASDVTVIRVDRRGRPLDEVPSPTTDDPVLVFLEEHAREPADVDWRDLVSAHLHRPGIGVVGGALSDRGGRIVDGGLWIGVSFRGRFRPAGVAWRGLPRRTPGPNGRAHLIQSVSAVSLSFLAVRSSVLVAAGGLDTSLGSAADVDLCLRLGGRGLRTLWLPELVATAARGQRRTRAEGRECVRRHGLASRDDGNVAPAMGRLTRYYEARRRDDALGVRSALREVSSLAPSRHAPAAR